MTDIHSYRTLQERAAERDSWSWFRRSAHRVRLLASALSALVDQAENDWWLTDQVKAIRSAGMVATREFKRGDYEASKMRAGSASVPADAFSPNDSSPNASKSVAYMSISLIIDRIGVTALARALGHVNVSTVSSWKYRGSIPVEYWASVMEEASKINMPGLTYEVLAKACSVRRTLFLAAETEAAG